MTQSFANWKQDAAKRWGPLMQLPRAEAIFSACAFVESEGGELVREQIRELIGGGSFRDIDPVVALYKAQAALRSDKLFASDTLLAVLANAVEQHLEKCHDDFAEKHEQLAQSFSDSYDGFGQSLADLEAELAATAQQKTALSDQVKTLQAERAHCHEQMAVQEANNAQLKEKNQQLLTDNDALVSQNKQLRGEILALKDQHAKIISDQGKDFVAQKTELVSLHEKETARLMTTHANMQQLLKNDIKILNKTMAQSTSEHKKLVAKLGERDISLNELQTRLSSLLPLKKQNEALEKELTHLHSVQNENRLLAAQIEQQGKAIERFALLSEQIGRIEKKQKQKPEKSTTKAKVKRK